MTSLESIVKLRESLNACQFDTYWITIRACDVLIDEIEREIAERYIELPVDADGVPIHVGDNLYSEELKKQFPCRGYSLTLTDKNDKWWTVECSYDPYSGTSEYAAAKSCRHVKPRTVEDVLEEFLHTAADACAEANCELEEQIAKYANELRDLIKEGEL